LADDGLLAGARGAGAMWAAAMKPGQDATVLRARILEQGVIVRPIGDHTLTFCPPLVMTDAEIDRVVDSVAAAAGAA
jgi:adenosylmethionine-8-amino-7-oxononanoate aminotransferase